MRGFRSGRSEAIDALAFCYDRYSRHSPEWAVKTKYKPNELQALLVNTTGELKYFYEHAAVIFVGKSLKAEGGQNPIEPGALGKPVVFGPNMQNFEAIAQSFVSQNAAVQVRDEKQ